jgi:hypothetical protein
MQRLRSEPAMQRQFMRRGQMQAQLVAQYLARVARFKEKLAVAIHITGGQPARAPELLSIQHVNTQASRHRNVFIEDGMVTLVTAYHKGFHASNDIKLIHRYVPRAVGELVVWYMWLVLPFTEQLTTWQAAQQQQAAAQPAGQPAGRGLGLGLDRGREDAQARAPRVGLAAHPSTQPAGAAAAASGLGLGLASPYLWGPDAGTQRAWTSDRFREVLKRETQARLGQALNIPAYRDIAIGISRRFMRGASAFTSDAHAHDEKEQPAAAEFDADHEEGMDAEQWMAHIADLQAAHSSHVAGMVYARQITEQAGTTSHRRAMFRQSSVEWHEFLGFSQDDEGGSGQPHPAGNGARAPSGSQAVVVRVNQGQGQGQDNSSRDGQPQPAGNGARAPSGSQAVVVRVNASQGQGQDDSSRGGQPTGNRARAPSGLQPWSVPTDEAAGAIGHFQPWLQTPRAPSPDRHHHHPIATDVRVRVSHAKDGGQPQPAGSGARAPSGSQAVGVSPGQPSGHADVRVSSVISGVRWDRASGDHR